jgi:hypothetical protein
MRTKKVKKPKRGHEKKVVNFEHGRASGDMMYKRHSR